MRLTFMTLGLGALLLLAPRQAEEASGPEVGQPAPIFRLNDHNGNGTLIGGEKDAWTIVAFYPKALTPG